MVRRSLRHLGTTLALLALFAGQETWALASVTGGLAGTVVDADTSAPIAGAQVTATSPSQSVTTTTDAAGHFTFLTLSPDTYTVTASKSGFQSTSVPGQVVFADTIQSVPMRMPKALRTIAHVTATSAGSLVKSGTTSDIYSINASTQAAAAALGGGGSLNQAYSAIATVPGAYVIPNQSGYYQTVNIRGGDYDQVGYEFDGVPVNRSFDNYASSSASSLGNAEVQVYTGANPATSEGQGLAGYINQVIKTGTFPGYATGSLGIATPTFYHRAALEVGGSTPDRNFSYYIGIAGLNQAFNVINAQNGAEYTEGGFGPPLGVVPNGSFAPAGYIGNVALFGPANLPTGPVNWSTFSTIYGRNTVMNFHIGIPHRNDAGRDDIQLLYDNESLKNQFYISSDDTASPFCTGAAATSAQACTTAILGGLPTFFNTYTWGCASSIGGTFSRTALNAQNGCVRQYSYPSSTNVGGTGPISEGGNGVDPNVIPPAARDNSYNNTSVVKISYTKNFSSSAYLRVYGYTFYSNWFLNGPYSFSYCDFVCPVAPDYNLNAHSRGVSAEFQDQINEQNLLSVQGSFVTSRIVRDNNGFYNLFPQGNEAVVVNQKAPYSGYCFSPSASTTNPVNCLNNTVGLGFNYSVPALPGGCAIPGKPSDGSACTYMVAENGLNGTYSGTIPNFYGASLTDQYRPSDKLLFNVGVRLDSFGFIGQDTLVPPLGGSADARAFWFNAYNLDNCINNATGVPFVPNNFTPGTPCPAGAHAANVVNASGVTSTFNIWQPRISGTYTLDPNNVVRFSYGRYTEAPNTAFEQYNTRQEDLADYLGSHFLAFGRNTPSYPIAPPTSINYDVSWEKHLKGTDWSFKFTPFLRQTQDQIQQFFLNVKQGFVSGLNVGSQRSQGFEFQTQKGDFSRDGISGLLSFAYTDSYIHYGPIAAGASGTTVLGGIETAIGQYNAYTKICAVNPKNPNCGTTSNGMTAGPCYNQAGTPIAAGPGGGCPSGDIANPYWNQPIQPLIPTGQAFPTFDTFPGAPGLAAQGFGSPYVGTIVLNYRHDKYAITPSFQFQGGGKYGVPLVESGIDPAAGGCLPLKGMGTRYDATTCANLISIPNPFTGVFDPIGSFTQPNSFIMNLQLSYDLNPRIQLVGVLASLVNTCWGGTHTPWTISDGNICAYNNVTGSINPVAPYGTPGAIVNPPGFQGSIIQSFRKYPYEGNFGPAIVSAENQSIKTPLNFYFTANLKI